MIRIRRSLLWAVPVAMVLAVPAVWLVHGSTGGLIAITLLLGAMILFSSWGGLTAAASSQRILGYGTVAVAVAGLAVNLAVIWTREQQGSELAAVGRELLLATIVLTVFSIAVAIKPRALKVAGLILALVGLLIAINLAPAWAGGAPLLINDSVGLYLVFGAAIFLEVLLYPISLLTQKKSSEKKQP
jgi:hypothetical protein